MRFSENKETDPLKTVTKCDFCDSPATTLIRVRKQDKNEKILAVHIIHSCDKHVQSALERAKMSYPLKDDEMRVVHSVHYSPNGTGNWVLIE